MFDNMHHIRKNMWLTVIVFSIIGDVGTTWFAVHTPGLIEQSPLWIGMFESGNLLGLLVGKCILVASAFALDYILVEYMGNWAFPFIPVSFIYSGVGATLGNLVALDQVGANSFAIGLVLTALAIGIVEFIHSRFNYPLF